MAVHNAPGGRPSVRRASDWVAVMKGGIFCPLFEQLVVAQGAKADDARGSGRLRCDAYRWRWEDFLHKMVSSLMSAGLFVPYSYDLVEAIYIVCRLRRTGGKKPTRRRATFLLRQCQTRAAAYATAKSAARPEVVPLVEADTVVAGRSAAGGDVAEATGRDIDAKAKVVRAASAKAGGEVQATADAVVVIEDRAATAAAVSQSPGDTRAIVAALRVPYTGKRERRVSWDSRRRLQMTTTTLS